MPIELNKQESQECVASLQTYFRKELDQEIGEMKPGSS